MRVFMCKCVVRVIRVMRVIRLMRLIGVMKVMRVIEVIRVMRLIWIMRVMIARFPAPSPSHRMSPNKFWALVAPQFTCCRDNPGSNFLPQRDNLRAGPKTHMPQTLQKCDCPKSSLGCRRALASLHTIFSDESSPKVETICRETACSCFIFHNRLWLLGERVYRPIQV